MNVERLSKFAQESNERRGYVVKHGRRWWPEREWATMCIASMHERIGVSRSQTVKPCVNVRCAFRKFLLDCV